MSDDGNGRSSLACRDGRVVPSVGLVVATCDMPCQLSLARWNGTWSWTWFLEDLIDGGLFR
jgi:hypothetical protein